MQGPSVKDGLTTRAARLGVSFLAAFFFFILISSTPTGSHAQDATPVALVTPVSALSTAGAAGIGDPYYPLLGNGGYDVKHYTIALNIDVASGALNDATTTIDAVSTQDLSALNLDFRGPEIDEVTVDGQAADWSRDDGELTVTPQEPLVPGVPFAVMVHYQGMPDSDDDRFEKGWWATGNSVFALGEPRGSDVWYPVNGHPFDKATYTLEITVPEEYEVVANGHRREVAIADGLDGQSTRTVVWENDDPTASYLVMFHVAHMDVSIEERPDGITLVEAFPPSVDEQSRTVLEGVPEMVEFFESIFGLRRRRWKRVSQHHRRRCGNKGVVGYDEVDLHRGSHRPRMSPSIVWQRRSRPSVGRISGSTRDLPAIRMHLGGTCTWRGSSHGGLTAPDVVVCQCQPGAGRRASPDRRPWSRPPLLPRRYTPGEHSCWMTFGNGSVMKRFSHCCGPGPLSSRTATPALMTS